MADMTVAKIEAKQLSWIVPPVCQGQIVEVSYACDRNGAYRRSYDRSDRSTSYAFCAIEDCPDALCDFDPANAEPDYDFEPVDD